MNLANNIEEKIKQLVKQVKTKTQYREPLIGFASTEDPLFTEIKEVVGEHHAHPKELLPGAKTVVCFFIPFSEEVVKSNRANQEVSREWAVAYIETNALIGSICKEVRAYLKRYGIDAYNEKATHNFNKVDLTSIWSHRSAAYVAGLGTFGVNHMLITPLGCAGRFGSIIISAEIPATPRPDTSNCKYLRDGTCLACVKNCPTGALKEQFLDKQRCYQHVIEVDEKFPDLGLTDVCGKCVIGPCALNPF